MLRRFLAPLAALLALSGCILVDDFSPKWAEGKMDSCTSKIAESLYDPEGKDMKELARSFTIDKFHFLMLKKDAADKGGRMYRFGIQSGIFQRYRLDPAMKKTFLRDYPNAPVSLAHDTVELKQLGDAEIKLLSDISANADYWEIEDQTLYNALRNQACIYEDRDLAGEEATEKTKAEDAKRKAAAKEKAAQKQKANQ